MDLEFYMKCTFAIILTCIAILVIVAMVLGITAMTQDIIERISDITSVFKRWKKSKIPDDFYHKNLDEAIKLCGDKADNYSLNFNERSSYRALETWLMDYKDLRNKYEQE